MTFDKAESIFDVHGGVSWFDKNLPASDDSDAYYIGFDAAHSTDWTPILDYSDVTYKDVKFMVQEVNDLLTQVVNYHKING